MATFTMPATGGVHHTTSGVTADRINPVDGSPGGFLEVLSRDSTNYIYARGDGNVAVATGDGTTAIPPLGWALIEVKSGKFLSVVGITSPYSVDAVDHGDNV